MTPQLASVCFVVFFFCQLLYGLKNLSGLLEYFFKKEMVRTTQA